MEWIPAVNAAPPAKGSAVMSELRNRSLCCTCLHEEACLSVREMTTPVIHCELFEVEQPGDVRPRTMRAHTREVIETDSDVKEEPAGLMGLCINCDCRFDCRLPRPEAGVWHCEEYK